MKKNYIVPNAEITNLKIQSLLTTVSGDELDWGGDGSGRNPSSRHKNLWDDDAD